MRDVFVSILAVVAMLAGCCCSDKDGFNYYKDYLRGRSDEVPPEAVGDGDRMLYFYRTPLQLYPGLLPAFEQEYKKRTGNAFKNHMLNKEMLVEAPGKRSSKAALSLMLQGKHPYPNANLGETVEIPLE